MACEEGLPGTYSTAGRPERELWTGQSGIVTGVGVFLRFVCMESSGDLSLVGHHTTLSSRLKKLTAASIMFAACAVAAWGTLPGSLTAAGDTRTLSIYHVHTKESLTITYKKNGRYIPSALAKINYVLRDWRRNEVITID